MIRRGRGAFVDPEDRRRSGLQPGELAILKAMMTNYNGRFSTSEWADKLTLPEHRVSGFMSYLKGMDLVKSSADEKMLTDEEIKFTDNYQYVVYWIGERGEPIHKRAEEAIRENGNLKSIIAGYFKYDLALWPDRPEQSITLKAQVVRLDAHRIILEFNTTAEKKIKLGNISDAKEVLINIETL